MEAPRSRDATTRRPRSSARGQNSTSASVPTLPPLKASATRAPKEATTLRRDKGGGSASSGHVQPSSGTGVISTPPAQADRTPVLRKRRASAASSAAVATSGARHLQAADQVKGIGAADHPSIAPMRKGGEAAAARGKCGKFFELTGGRPVLWIPEVECRGVNLAQLLALRSFIAKCKADDGTLEGWTDNLQAMTVTYITANLYHVADQIIKPLTLPDSCSYVEAVAENRDSQQPRWFVSHWWGEPVTDFVSCIEAHVSTRGLATSAAYWVCAYANNQHELGKDLGSDPRQSSFFKAMHVATGVLLILDRVGPATPFDRIWCCFEESVAVLQLDRDEKEPLLLDIVTTKGDEVQLLTDGLTAEEARLEEEYRRCPFGVSGWVLKSEREAAFPIEIVRKGLEIDITEARASMAIDKTRILNALAGKAQEELDSPLHERALGNPVFSEVNCALRGIFAVAAWRRAMEASIDISASSDLPLTTALREDTRRRALTLNLAGCSDLSDSDVQLLVYSLPLQLQQVTLSFNDCEQVTSLLELELGCTKLPQLKLLKLDFSGCSGLCSLHGFGAALNQCPILQTFGLALARVDALSDIGPLARALASVSTLRHLALDFSHCRGLASVEELGDTLQNLTDLESLKMDFSYCSQLTSLNKLASSLKSLSVLTRLTLNLEDCALLANLSGFHEGLPGLQSLASIEANFVNCSGLMSIAELGQGLEELGSPHVLTLLDMNFHGCTALAKGIPELGRGVAKLIKLQTLMLNFWKCQKLNSLEPLGPALFPLQNIRDVFLGFRYCEHAVDGSCFYEGMHGLASATSLRFDASYCISLVDLPRLGSSMGKLTNLTWLQFLIKGIASDQFVMQLGKALPALKYLEILDIDFAYSEGLTALFEFGQGLGKLQCLKDLKLRLNDCPLTRSDHIGAGLAELCTLQRLKLRLDNTRIDGIEGLGRGMAGLRALTNFELDLEGTPNIRSVDELGRGLQDLQFLTDVNLNFGNCVDLETVEGFGRCLMTCPNLAGAELQFEGCTRLPKTFERWFPSLEAFASAVSELPELPPQP